MLIMKRSDFQCSLMFTKQGKQRRLINTAVCAHACGMHHII